MNYTLWTVTESNGDGSYSVKLHSTQASADRYAESVEESSGEDVSHIELKFDDGKLFYKDYDPETYKDFWAELEGRAK